MSRQNATRGRGTAVVIGGGLAGTLAAWALRGVAERVVVVERDRYPSGPDFRAGVPQARHAHLLLEAGHRIIEELMPGIGAELLAAGASRIAMSHELRWLGPAGWMAPHDSDVAFYSCTRPLLDFLVLRRARTDPRIEFRENTDVIGLIGTARVIDGVNVRDRNTRSQNRIEAELVIDASGRSSRVPDWLAGLGCAPIAEEIVDAGVSYLSRLYERPPETDPGFKALYLQTRAPQHRYTGSLLPVEERRWLCSVGSIATESLSGETGFEVLLSRMRDPILAETLAGAHPVGPVRAFRPKPSVRRHYERHAAPDGLVVLGDAGTSFNPVFGQGMSVAALGAWTLRQTVRRHNSIGHRAARATRHTTSKSSRDAWLMSSSEDTRFPETLGGPTGPLTGWLHRYLDHVLDRATHDAAVAASFAEVMSLVAAPTTLLHPRVLASVLRGIG
ncbi:NAD(P)/FAD-dependent oxidoreductase [Nocardia noduli]|uniref:NAD(P)/FAD-dependent oxidoreductase n=1 Tax=Nocardia noduli TaxID=2815722 RepID=UPI001C239805|nr:FAD-dependent monooxygenase [Nocardia noduli]